MYHRWDAWRAWLAAARDLGIRDPHLRANTLRAMGDVLQFQDDLEGAMGHYRQALALFEQVGSRLGQANVLAAQSRLALLQGDDARAQDLLAQAVALHQAIGSCYDMATDYFNFGLVLRDLGRADEARPYFLQAAALYDEINLPHYAQQARQLAGE